MYGMFLYIVEIIYLETLHVLVGCTITCNGNIGVTIQID